ncbi:MAG: hypothetical protein ACUVWP_09425 [bacterium]
MTSIIEFIMNFNLSNIPEKYLIIGGTVFFIFVILLSDINAPAVIGLIIHIFRFVGRESPWEENM